MVRSAITGRDEIQAAYDRTPLLQERHHLVQAWADYLDSQQASESRG